MVAPDRADGPPAEAAQWAAVRAAEQTVSDAWIGHLLAIERESESTLTACRQARDRVENRLRRTEVGGDRRRAAELRAHLTAADHGYATALECHAWIRDFLARELSEWAAARQRRTAAPWPDDPRRGWGRDGTDGG